MKRILSVLCIFVILISTHTVFATYEECSEFSCVDDYNGTVYSLYRRNGDGGFHYSKGNVDITYLPYGMMDHGIIYGFTIYNDKIYYSTGEEGSDPDSPAYIYSCDLNGQNNVLLADNVAGGGWIIDNTLYYSAYKTRDSYSPQGYYGGIYKINLNDLSWAKILNTTDTPLYHFDGEYFYYGTNIGGYGGGSAFAIGCNGQGIVAINPICDEYGYINNFERNYNQIIKGNTTYYILNNKLYKKLRNGFNSAYICDVPNGAQLTNVTENYIYYTKLEYAEPIEQRCAKIYQISRN